MASRPALFALPIAAVALLPGCHAGGASGLSSRPAATPPGVSLTATEAIERHNINAARVQALVAQPRITVDSPGIPHGSVDGRMALERPRNFKLQMFAPMRRQVADIGSNDDGFWFWTDSKGDKSVYVCSYDDLDRTAISAAFQPDWIVEAMGLRSISRDEAKQMTSAQGDLSGTVKLVSTRRGKNGEVLTKETVLDQSGRIKEHLLYQGQGRTKTLIASAVIDQFKPFAVAGKESVTLPSRFHLAWIPENLKLDVVLDAVTLRDAFSDDERLAKFSEPEIPGMRRTNIADLAPARNGSATARPSDPATAPAPRTRTSRSAPTSTGSSVRLGSPEPFGVDDSARASRDPIALSDDASAPASDASIDRVVRPVLPRAVDR